MRKNTTKLFYGVTVLIFVVMGIACDKDKPPQTPTQSDDEKIVEIITKKIDSDSELAGHKFEVSSKDSKVQVTAEKELSPEALDKLTKILFDTELAKEFALMNSKVFMCNDPLCWCRGSCMACGPNCEPTPMLKVPELIDTSIAQNPAHKNIKANVVNDVLELRGRIDGFENGSKFIALLAEAKVPKARIDDLVFSR